jgi:hypothetical protein
MYITGLDLNSQNICHDRNPYAFMRRIAFILTVNRYGVSALLYNVNPHTTEM